MPTELGSNSHRRARVVIIGGGITGLAAAHRLVEIATQQGIELSIQLLEASSRLGGVIKTTHSDGFLLEAGADSFISEKPEAIELAKRLGIEQRLIQTNEQHRRSFIVRKGKLRPVPEGFQLLAPSHFWPFVTTDIFSWPGKARMALDLVIPRRSDDGDESDESLAQFVRRRLGTEALERMAQPMVGGIYTADPETLSLRATLPRFLDMEREHGSVIRAMWKKRKVAAQASGARYSLFLSFDQGMQVLIDSLASRLPEGSVQLNSRVGSIAFHESAGQWHIRLSSGKTIDADVIILALPAYAAASLLREVDRELARDLNRISFASTATINLAYRRADVPHALDGFGFVVPFIEKRTLMACTFSSVKFAGRAPADHVLLRAFAGGALQPDVFELDEDELLRRVRFDLQELLGIKQPPLFSLVEKWRDSMPQYNVGHLEIVGRMNERASKIPGLIFAGNSYTGVGVPDCIRSGESAADEVLARRPS